ncbi:MAG: response regulator [Planctomycetota bacterium]
MSDQRYILVVEDERDLAELLRYNLNISGYEAEVARDGQDALAKVAERRPDLFVLDLMLPVFDGITVAEQLKSDSETARVPIIMLTAKASDADQIAGLRSGADDYVTKPFSVPVLMARIESVLRRSTGSQDTNSLYSVGPIELDSDRHEVRLDSTLVKFTLTEFRLLAVLVTMPGRVLTRQSLISRAIGPGITVTERTVDVHVAAIRRKLGAHGKIIKTVRGVGYRIDEQP